MKFLGTNLDQNTTKLTEKVCIIKKLSKLLGGVWPQHYSEKVLWPAEVLVDTLGLNMQ